MRVYIGEERLILTGKAREISSMLKQYAKHHIWVTELLKKRL
ncbi:Z-ring formation inhibitor MciZ [Bacillus smithii]